MHNILFSVLDLSLIATIIECALIFCLIVIARIIPAPSRLCRYSLGLLFIAIALDSLTMLLIWHDGLRFYLENYSPISILIGTLALASKGPLLYIFIKTITRPNYTLKPLHLLHALPFVAGLAVALIAHLDTHAIATTLDSNERSIGSVYWWTILRLAPTLYAIASLISLRRMNALYDSHYTGDEYHYSYWIKILTVGFLVQWGLALSIHIAGQYLPLGLVTALGKSNDLLALALVNGLLVYCFTIIRTLTPILGNDEPPAADTTPPQPNRTHLTKNGDSKHQDPTPRRKEGYIPSLHVPANTPEDEAIIEAIIKNIEHDKLHLNHTLNLEKLANAVMQPSKEVSRLINTHFQYSFSEFINAYRTLEAEQLLAAPEHQETPIHEIIHLSGFNSKSAFHRFFKRFTGMSPSEYRKQNR